MAKGEFFIILICSIHGFRAKAFPPPKLTVSRSVIIETASVTLNCEGPPSFSVSTCYFYTRSGRTNHEFLCNQKLTGTELLKMANRSPPTQVELNCCYHIQSETPCSEYSDIFSINIQTLALPKLTVNPTVITETDSVALTCKAPSSVSVSTCYFYTSAESKGLESNSSCHQLLTGKELLVMAKVVNPSLPVEVKVNCRYTAWSGQVLSPYGNPSSILIQNEKEMKTDLTTFIPSITSAGATSNTVSYKTGSSAPFSVLWKLKIGFVVLTGFGSAVAIILLVFTFVIHQSAAKVASGRSKSVFKGDQKDTKQHAEVISTQLIKKTPGNLQPYMIVTTADCAPADLEVHTIQENENYDPANFYHIYSTIPD